MPRVALALFLVAVLPGVAWPADEPVSVVTRTVEALAPSALPIPGGFRFTVDGVAVSVLADEGAGLLRVIARAGEIGEREVRLVASALSPDMVPDSGVRMVSVRGLLCAAVLAPLRGLTDVWLHGAVDRAVAMAREAAHAADPDEPAAPDPGAAPAGLPEPIDLTAHATPTSR